MLSFIHLLCRPDKVLYIVHIFIWSIKKLNTKGKTGDSDAIGTSIAFYRKELNNSQTYWWIISCLLVGTTSSVECLGSGVGM